MTPVADIDVEPRPMVSVGPGRADDGAIPLGSGTPPTRHLRLRRLPVVPSHVPEQRPMTAVGARRPD